MAEKTVTEKMIEIFSKLKIEMNGAVSGAMAERGVSYGLNYGVSAVTIKNVAKDYAPDHLLAQGLWRQQIREMKLGAIFIDNPPLVTVEQMEQWIQQANTIELAQQCAAQLFWQAPGAPLMIERWLCEPSAESQGQLKVMAALMMAGRLAHNHKLSGELASKIVRCGLGAQHGLPDDAPLHLYQALRYALCQIYATEPKLQSTIKQIPDPELQNQLHYI